MLGMFKNKLSSQSGLLMKYGVKTALGVLIIGIFAYKYNQWFIGGYANQVFCINIIQTAFSLFVQFIMGGLILDCVIAKK